MQLPAQITFRGTPHSEAVEARIREQVAKLDEFYAQIMSCRVLVEGRHHHHHQGNLYHVRVEIEVPGKDIVASHEQHDQHAHEDVYVAIRDAFNAARRQLQDHAREQRSDVKHHEPPLHGEVLSLDGDQGRILCSDGREIDFHRNSVIDGSYDRLLPGSEVRFAVVADAEGVRATTVRAVGKHHIG